MTFTDIRPHTSHRAPRIATPSVVAWVERIAALTEPDAIYWCDGSDAERQQLFAGMVDSGTLTALNPNLRPGSYLARSNPDDVARVESRTFVCPKNEADAGPTNNWVEPGEMRDKMKDVFEGSMRGRTMYVVPFAMGPVGSPMARYGVQVTDSPYVVVSTGTMTRMGAAALGQISENTAWVPAIHSVGAPLAHGEQDVAWPCNPTKYIVHFPETREIWSYGSAYGGNAILAKKAFALRIASTLSRSEGWMAAHMLLLKVTDTAGTVSHVAAAFPSACGKTNFAMMTPTVPGMKVETIGDDIAWLAPDSDGKLRAINPEAGFFGVAPGTGVDTNPIAIDTLTHDTIFTNVALTDDGDVWWEGLTEEAPAHLIDWKGNDWAPGSATPAAHPNSRFAVAAAQCPTIADDWEAPEGVVVDALIFGGRRATNIPLVAQARSWEHGVYIGSTLASERTAAAEGTLGELRRDPFAMLPFAGMHMADHWQHWLDLGDVLSKSSTPPPIFQVNWFRKGSDGSFLWPGFSENSRVLEWILARAHGEVAADSGPFGLVPREGQIDFEAAGIDRDAWLELFALDHDALRAEARDTVGYLDSMGSRVPHELHTEHRLMQDRLANARRLSSEG
ncbi:phosphoenolpyruvate carboxykinase (GTP) [Demequina oxidasica]|uniref:phosphoenolpyruvate carboxykinase (GTP) n=1 Tax=Demequina oxidasica TaxID=676199 RepID=UPI0007825051|nr:phosphoenolpyruvate carboxykinase (GTP) [Demequina oxidasica]